MNKIIQSGSVDWNWLKMGSEKLITVPNVE